MVGTMARSLRGESEWNVAYLHAFCRLAAWNPARPWACELGVMDPLSLSLVAGCRREVWHVVDVGGAVLGLGG